MGGVADTSRIAKWDGANWTKLGTGASGAFPVVSALAFDKYGVLYAGGTFDLMGGVANTLNIAKWDGSNWTPLATGASSYVNSFAYDSKAHIMYAVGAFENLGGATGDYIAKWNGTAWSVLAALSSTGNILLLAPDGKLYVGGAFTTAGGVACNYIAVWNGVSFSPLGSGLNGAPYAMFMDTDNSLYVGGPFTTAGGITLPEGVAIWTGSTWTPIDVDLPSATQVYSFVKDKSDNLFITSDASGTAVSAIVPTGGVSSATTSYPKIKFTGPGAARQLKNYTTGKSVFFNLTLLAGETAVLDLDPKSVSFVSSFRGSIMNAILPGSDLSWELLPGVNNVSTFLFGPTSAATFAALYNRDQYESIDQAVR
jgi:hypothetical protein